MKTEPAIDALQTHLKAASTGLKTVESVGGYLGADGAPKASPSAAVFYAGSDYRERASLSDRKLGHARFVVLIALKQAGKDGGDALPKLQTVKNEVIGVLDGWKHPDCRDVLELKRSRLLVVDGKTSTLWWELTFTAAHYLAE